MSMSTDKSTRHSRIKEALNRLYDHEPPQFREYLKRFKEEPTSRVFAPLAEAYRRMGKVDEAIEICHEGLKHHPEFPGGRVALAKCYVDRHEHEQALRELETVIRLAPENLLAQRLMADSYVVLGDRENALHRYRMALLLSPADVTLSEKIHRLEQGLEESEAQAAEPEEQLEDAVSVSLAPKPPPLPRVDETPAPPPWMNIPDPSEELEEEDMIRRTQVNAILGMESDDAEEDGFKVGQMDDILADPASAEELEITTETLGDLYYSQEQYEKSLRIFEKLALSRGMNTEINEKIQKCRKKLGVDDQQIAAKRKIEQLQTILQRVRRG